MSGRPAGAKVSVIIVNYNGRRWLKDCFESLQRQTHTNVEIILVDNASTDGSVDYVRARYPQIKVIKNAHNMGFASGNNTGVRAATGAFVLLLNPDTIASEHLLENLLQAFTDIPQLGCVQPKLLFMYDSKKLDSCGSMFTQTGFLKHVGNQQRAADPRWNIAFPVLSVKGACMMFPQALLDRTNGLFDDDYFCYFEETDFCLRVWLAGYECWYYPQAHLRHATGGVSGTSHVVNSFIQYHSYKNRLTTHLKNLALPTLLRVLPVCLTFYGIIGLALLFGGQPWNTYAVFRAIGYCLIHLPTTLKKRRRIQRQVRRVPDDAFLPRVTQMFSVKAMAHAIYHHVAYEWLQRKLRSNPQGPRV